MFMSVTNTNNGWTIVLGVENRSLVFTLSETVVYSPWDIITRPNLTYPRDVMSLGYCCAGPFGSRVGDQSFVSDQ